MNVPMRASTLILCLFLAACGPLIEGQEGQLKSPSGGQVIVARDQQTLDEAAKGGDTQAMLADGRIFLAPSGTRVRVLDADARGYTVELLDGSGRRGEVPAAFVQ